MIGTGLQLTTLAQHRKNTQNVVPPATFDPATLSLAGLFDASAPNSAFQDIAGTIPCEMSGDPIARLVDLSGAGADLEQVLADKQPKYETDGTLHWVSGDGVDDKLEQANFSAGVSHTVCIAADVIQTTHKNDSLFSLNANVGYYIRGKVTGQFFYELPAGGLGINAPSPRTVDSQFGKHIFTVSLDAVAGTVCGRIDGVEVWIGTGYSGDLSPIQNFRFLTNKYGSRCIEAKVFSCCIWNGTDFSDIEKVEDWSRQKAGLI